MSTKITQENLYLLLPLKIGWLASWLSEDKGISIAAAIKRIYHSQLYKKLDDIKSEIYDKVNQLINTEISLKRRNMLIIFY